MSICVYICIRENLWHVFIYNFFVIYILAIYFGSVGVKRYRYAVTCGLMADFAGMIAAVLFSYYFWG